MAQGTVRTDVAVAFRIRALADHRHHDVELRYVNALAVDAEGDIVLAGRLANTGQYRVAIREVGIGVGGALPGDRPAAALVRHVVRGLADHQDLLAACDRQDWPVVLEQHQRLAHGAARQLARLHDLVLAGVGVLRRALVEQAGAQLDADDAAHGIVDTRHRDLAAFHLLDGVGDKGLPVVRHHDHVVAGIDRGRAAVVAAARHFAVAVPVGDDEAVEAHLRFQDVGEHGAAAVHLAVVGAARHVVPGIERGHDGLHARLQGRIVAGAVDVDHLRFAGLVDAAVLAELGAAVANEMLGGGDGVGVILQVALHAAHVGAGIAFHDVRILGIALVGASPAVVAHHRQGGAEDPGDAAGTRGFRGGRADFLHQLRVARRAQADVVREQGGAEHVVVAMDGVRAPHDRHLDRHVGGHRGLVVALRQRQPFGRLGMLVPIRPAAAAVEHRTEVIALDVFRRGALDLGLGHLADLLRQRHLADDVTDALFERRVPGDGAAHGRPVIQGGCRSRKGQRDGQRQYRVAKHGFHGVVSLSCCMSFYSPRRKERYHLPLPFRRRCWLA